MDQSLTKIGKLLDYTQVQKNARYTRLSQDSIHATTRTTGAIGENLSPAQNAESPSRRGKTRQGKLSNPEL